MLLDGHTELPGDLTADVVVAGGGTVGLYLASAMANAGQTVVVVEAGAAVAVAAGSVGTTVVGRRQDGVVEGRARGLGGTSVLWGGQLTEFDVEDFIRPGASWPVSREQLDPWYRAVYARLGIGPLWSDVAYRRRLGGETGSTGRVERFFTYWLPQPNFARLFRRGIMTDRRLTVVVNATANGIDFAGDRAVSLRVLAGGRTVDIRGKTFVFALGTIANARFFLSSARSDSVPWGQQDLIGVGFQDHIAGPVGRVTVSDETRFRDFFENAVVDGVKLQPKLRFAASERAGASTRVGVSGSFVFQSDLAIHLANIKHVVRAMRSAAGFSGLARLPAALVATGRSFLPLIWRYLRDRRVMAFFDKSLDFMVQCEQIPLATSRIVLDGGVTEADGLYSVAVDWRVDGGEIDRIAQFAEAVDGYLRATGIGSLVIDPRLRARDPAFIDGLIDTIHHSGGMPMGTDAATGVVDADLRVFGTANVHVAGAAVFPTSSHANCTLTALALAERLAAHLASAL